MSKYKLICMAFDGEYQSEREIFTDIDKAWDYSNDLGSKWYFYPFHFVVNESGKTIKGTPHGLEIFSGAKVKTVANIFKTKSRKEEIQGMSCEQFIEKLNDLVCV